MRITPSAGPKQRYKATLATLRSAEAKIMSKIVPYDFCCLLLLIETLVVIHG